MCRLFERFYIVTIMIIIVMVTGCKSTKEPDFQEVSLYESENESASEIVEDKRDEEVEKIYVHVCGHVKNPGVYEFVKGSRIYEALEMAGGFTKDAAVDVINQAEILSDGQKLYVPSMEEFDSQNISSEASESGKININKASKEELMTLSGIGESKADSIIRYREEKGEFQSIEEIMEIEGIKEGVFRKIEDQISVS